jgi:REP element-mobilizing transposase RayT
MQTMALPPQHPLRRSHRLQGYDYRDAASYFVTICTSLQRPIFGQVVEDAMEFAALGHIANQEWERTCALRPMVVPHVHCVMPNHVHLLFSINTERDIEPSTEQLSRRGLKAGSVGTIVGGYKAAVTSRIRTATSKPEYEVWQRNYHDHVVRNEQSFERIAEYIVNNPAVWKDDVFHFDNRRH